MPRITIIIAKMSQNGVKSTLSIV